jgi:hypothetical protein
MVPPHKRRVEALRQKYAIARRYLVEFIKDVTPTQYGIKNALIKYTKISDINIT